MQFRTASKSIKSPGMEKMVLKFTWKFKGLRVANTFLKMNKVVILICPHFEVYNSRNK
jgi:hypothetical protein